MDLQPAPSRTHENGALLAVIQDMFALRDGDGVLLFPNASTWWLPRTIVRMAQAEIVRTIHFYHQPKVMNAVGQLEDLELAAAGMEEGDVHDQAQRLAAGRERLALELKKPAWQQAYPVTLDNYRYWLGVAFGIYESHYDGDSSVTTYPIPVPDEELAQDLVILNQEFRGQFLPTLGYHVILSEASGFRPVGFRTGRGGRQLTRYLSTEGLVEAETDGPTVWFRIVGANGQPDLEWEIAGRTLTVRSGDDILATWTGNPSDQLLVPSLVFAEGQLTVTVDQEMPRVPYAWEWQDLHVLTQTQAPQAGRVSVVFRPQQAAGLEGVAPAPAATPFVNIRGLREFALGLRQTQAEPATVKTGVGVIAGPEAVNEYTGLAYGVALHQLVPVVFLVGTDQQRKELLASEVFDPKDVVVAGDDLAAAVRRAEQRLLERDVTNTIPVGIPGRPTPVLTLTQLLQQLGIDLAAYPVSLIQYYLEKADGFFA